jgi:hypothetical protein
MTTSRPKNTLAAAPSPTRRISIFAAALLTIALSTPVLVRSIPKQFAGATLTAHEWGTFTSVAGAEGKAIEWFASRTSDLPAFVEHYAGAYGKAGLIGTIRMETPVIYFYAPRETTVSVHVSFAKGLITEWYPHASNVSPTNPPPSNQPVRLFPLPFDGSIAWNSVVLSPNTTPNFPHESAPSRYYAARSTSAIPVSVRTSFGNQHEKFLFYRGVSDASIPIAATILADGHVQLENLVTDSVPALILFERCGDNISYRIVEPLPDHATLETPAFTGNLDSLHSDFEKILISQGLYLDEARAMLETWRDSWFEEGSRLFYIVPRSFVDSILPLSIDPAPAQLTRVFVGRLELLSPRTQSSIESALSSHDWQTLQKYGRFLEPFAKLIIAKQSDPNYVARLRQDLDTFYDSPSTQAR